jgi:hypothetical protein
MKLVTLLRYIILHGQQNIKYIKISGQVKKCKSIQVVAALESNCSVLTLVCHMYCFQAVTSLYIGGTWSAELGCVSRVVRTLGSLYVDRLTCFRVCALAKHLVGGHFLK